MRKNILKSFFKDFIVQNFSKEKELAAKAFKRNL